MFYADYARRYRDADREAREAAREHWKRCNKENVAAGRADLVTFSAKLLGIIEGIEATEERQQATEAAHILEALDVLDTQYSHTKGAEAAGVGAETQRAFYAGCRLMLEVVAGYDTAIQRDEQTGKHRIIRREAVR